MTFRVGQKVVCVNDKPMFGWLWTNDKPEIGTVYTVARVIAGRYGSYQSLLLVEICNDDLGYRAERFRPVVERKTDISIFTKMLTGTKIGADV